MDSSAYLLSLFERVTVSPLTSSGALAIVLMVLCLIISAFFSGVETAFFSLSPLDLEELRESDSKRDAQILSIISRSEYFLGSILLGNNFTNIALVILTDYVVANTLDFSQTPVLGFMLQVVVLTFILLFFSEVLPKVYFQKNALKMARLSIEIVSVVMTFLNPITKGLVNLGNWVAEPLKNMEDKHTTPEELEMAIELTTEDEKEQGLLNEIVRFYQKCASDVMTPRIDIIGLEINTDYNKVKNIFMDKGYSRIPVYKDHIDNVKGVIYAKDLLPHLKNPNDFEWQSLMREALFVPENTMINKILEEFRQNKMHMAIVVDEFGGTSGLITMEDLLEEIFGEIEDEYDDNDKLYIKRTDGSYIFDAKISIVDFLRTVKLCKISKICDHIEEVDTLGGMLLEIKGDFPSVGEELELEGQTFKVLEMGKRRISKVLFIPQSTYNANDAPHSM